MNKKILYSIIIASTICLILLIRTHYLMYLDYNQANGKNKALFGLTELIIYDYRYYYGIVPAIGFVMSLIISTRKDLRKIAVISALVSLMAVVFSVFSVWRLFI